MPILAYTPTIPERPSSNAIPGIESGCVITDVWMPEIDGLDLVRSLKNRKVDVPVIVITGHSDVPLAVEAMKAGAADFIGKPYDGEVLLGAVRSALSARKTDEKPDSERAEIKKRLAALSARERQVLEGLVAGHQNKTIAHELGISDRTVEIYRANVMERRELRFRPRERTQSDELEQIDRQNACDESRRHRTRNLLASVPTRFVLSRQMLICIAKIGRTCRLVPSGTGPWSPVRDHFGDQFVRCTFAGSFRLGQRE